MGKPSRTILQSNHFDTTKYGYGQEDILRMEATWLVVYDGEIVGIRRHTSKHGTFKYIKLVYPERGRAVAVAKQLNADYDTDKFRVVKIDELLKLARPESFVDLDSESTPQQKRRRGRPTGRAMSNNYLRKMKIVAVEETDGVNLRDSLK